MPQKFLNIFLVLVLGIYSFSLFSFQVFSDEISDLEQQLEEKNQLVKEKQSTLSSIEKRIAEISGSNYSVSQKISLINAEINKLEESIEATEKDLDQKLKEIAEKQRELEKKQVLLDSVSSDLYMQSRHRASTFFLSSSGWSDMMESIFVRKNTITILQQQILKVSGEFSNLTEAKLDLDKKKSELDKERGDLDKSYKLLADEKARLVKELNSNVATKNTLKTQIGNLSKEISSLQNYLLIAKSGGTIVNSGSVPQSTSDPASSQKYFLDNAPPGSFGIFSFGGYTYRNGMSQWGARARAEAGQTYKQILTAYYPGKKISTVSTTGIKIKVKYCDNGSSCSSCINPRYVTYDLETEYLYRLGEMPDYFGANALRAQAITARTYALYRTDYGKSSIRGDECGQVIAGLKSTTWRAAVDATKGQVLTNSAGEVFSSQYAAVHGGWINGRGWDTTDGLGTGDWMSRAWESKSGVSWFYKNWFRKNYETSGNDCGHKPWLSMDEMTDIVNAYLLWTDKGKPDSDPRIVSVDVTKCWGQAANPYTISELRSMVNNPVKLIYGVVTSSSNGTTNTVRFNTRERGLISIPGDDFKKIFNMRAPSYLRIPQWSFVHINIEKK